MIVINIGKGSKTGKSRWRKNAKVGDYSKAK